MLRLVVLICVALGGLGCALTNAEIGPPDDVPSLPPGHGRGREVLVELPFRDGRPKGDRCGMKKNGYNMDTADVVCEQRPAQWIAEAIVRGLAGSGYRVLMPGSPIGEDTVVVRGTLTHFFVEPVIEGFSSHFEADVGFTLQVVTRSGLAARRAFFVKSETMAVLGTDDEIEQAAQIATKDAVRDALVAFTSLLETYPSVGAPSSGETTAYSVVR